MNSRKYFLPSFDDIISITAKIFVVCISCVMVLWVISIGKSVKTFHKLPFGAEIEIRNQGGFQTFDFGDNSFYIINGTVFVRSNSQHTIDESFLDLPKDMESLHPGGGSHSGKISAYEAKESTKKGDYNILEHPIVFLLSVSSGCISGYWFASRVAYPIWLYLN